MTVERAGQSVAGITVCAAVTLVVAAAWTAPSRRSWAIAPPSVVELATSAHPSARATAVTNDGVAVGWDADLAGEGFTYDLTTGIVTPIGTLPGSDWSHPSDVNDSGLVVGDAHFAGSPAHTEGFVRDPATHAMTSLGVAPGYTSVDVTAVDDAGLIVGQEETASSTTAVTFAPTTHVPSPIVGLPAGWHDAVVEDVNNHGIVVGSAVDPHGFSHAVAFDLGAGTMRTLGEPPGYVQGRAFGVDDAGEIVGKAQTGLGGTTTFTYDLSTHTLRDVGMPAGIPADVFGTWSAPNAAGIAAVSFGTSSFSHAYTLDVETGEWTPLPVPAGMSDATATDVNDHGVVVGSAFVATGPVIGSGPIPADAVAWIPAAAPTSTTSTTSTSIMPTSTTSTTSTSTTSTSTGPVTSAPTTSVVRTTASTSSVPSTTVSEPGGSTPTRRRGAGADAPARPATARVAAPAYTG